MGMKSRRFADDGWGIWIDGDDFCEFYTWDDFFEMKGRESDLRELDVQKAVSDLQKDAVLQQYQYFVGSSGNLSDDEDGIVLQKS